MAAWRKALHLRVCRLRQADLGHRGYHYARFEVAADGLVLGGLSRGHPFQRHFGPATPQPTRPRPYKSAWLLGAKLRRAMVAPGRSPLAGLAEVDETEIPLRTRDDPVAGGRGRRRGGKMLVAGGMRRSQSEEAVGMAGCGTAARPRRASWGERCPGTCLAGIDASAFAYARAVCSFLRSSYAACWRQAASGERWRSPSGYIASGCSNTKTRSDGTR